MATTYLQNEVVKLRAMEPADIDLLYEWENDTSVWRVSNTLAPFSRFTMEQYVATAHLDIYETRQLRLMIELTHSNTTVGSIDMFDFEPFHRRGGIGILIAPKERKKHYAAESLSVFIRYAFEVLQLHQLYCNISVDNKGSLHLFRSYGFRISGTKKAWNKTIAGWKDEYFLQLINSET